MVRSVSERLDGEVQRGFVMPVGLMLAGLLLAALAAALWAGPLFAGMDEGAASPEHSRWPAVAAGLLAAAALAAGLRGLSRR